MCRIIEMNVDDQFLTGRQDPDKARRVRWRTVIFDETLPSMKFLSS